MIKTLRRIVFFDRTILLLSFASLAAAIVAVTAIVSAGRTAQANTALRSQMEELRNMRASLITLKAAVDSREKKIGMNRSAGVVPSVEQTLSSLGLKANVLRPMEKTRSGNYTEESAEIEIQNIDLNGIVNLLYRIDSSPAPIKIGSASIKTSFEDPNRFLLKMTVSLLSKG